MNRYQLRWKLRKALVWDLVDVEGRSWGGDHAVVQRMPDGRWRWFWFERGREFDERVFPTEEEACQNLYEHLVLTPKDLPPGPRHLIDRILSPLWLSKGFGGDTFISLRQWLARRRERGGPPRGS